MQLPTPEIVFISTVLCHGKSTRPNEHAMNASTPIVCDTPGMHLPRAMEAKEISMHGTVTRQPVCDRFCLYYKTKKLESTER